MNDHVYEDDGRHGGPYGDVRHSTITARLDPDTRMYATLPNPSTNVPFVLYLGWTTSVQLHGKRAELERLHALIGRALEQDAAALTDTDEQS